MASLYPSLENNTQIIKNESASNFVQKRTYALDLSTMQFIKNPDGTVKLLDEFESYMQWCQLALITARTKFIAYSNKFGVDEVQVNLDHDLTESEIKRVTTEALSVHPLTESVSDFSFTWNTDIYFEFKVTSSLGSKTLSSNITKG